MRLPFGSAMRDVLSWHGAPDSCRSRQTRNPGQFLAWLSPFILFSECTACSSAAPVFNASDTPDFDLVLMDYRLPGMNGLRDAKLIMQQHAGVAVGLMSGSDDPTLSQRAYDAGLAAYLPNPLEIHALTEHLRALAAGPEVDAVGASPALSPQATTPAATRTSASLDRPGRLPARCHPDRDFKKDQNTTTLLRHSVAGPA